MEQPAAYIHWLRAELERAKKLPESEWRRGYCEALTAAAEVAESQLLPRR